MSTGLDKLDPKKKSEFLSVVKNKENPNNFKKGSKDYHLFFISQAILDHKEWISNVQVFVRNGNIFNAKKNIEENFTKCNFGKWYYQEGSVLNIFEEYKNIEVVHEMLHDTYLKIYELHKKRIQPKLFVSAKSQEQKKQRKINKLTKALHQYSALLEECMQLLSNEVRYLSEEEFSKRL